MIFGGSMGLYLLVEKRLGGQRLGNVGLNIDKKRTKDINESKENSAAALGLRPACTHTRRRAQFFFFLIGQSKTAKRNIKRSPKIMK
jgi:hypothetical protein